MISMEVTLWKLPSLDSVDSALYYYESKNNLEPELQENAFSGLKLSYSLKLKFK